MRLRWLPEALEDFENIVEYLDERSPQASSRIANELYDGIQSLTDFPQKGRVGEEPGTRQLIFRDLRYRVTYRIVDDVIELIEIVHTSRQQVIH